MIKVEFEAPCRIGDKIFCISEYGDEIWESVCNGYFYKDEGKVYVIAAYMIAYRIGVDAFLSYKEAEDFVKQRRTETNG